jgi:predicted HicB family RNase H-like nuclease
MSAPPGRPKTRTGTVNTALRLPKSLHAQLEQAATERDVSMNWLVLRALEDFLPRLIPVNEIQWTRKEQQ